MNDFELGGGLKVIRDELKGGFLLRKWVGLGFILVGISAECVGGVFVGMLIYGNATGTAAGIWIGCGSAISIVGNLIWQQARILSRR